MRSNILWTVGLVVAAMLVPSALLAGDFKVPHVFHSGTTIKSAEVNENFNAVGRALDAHDHFGQAWSGSDGNAGLSVTNQAASGSGLVGSSAATDTGAGVVGTATGKAGTAMRATYRGPGSGTALELENGALKATGATPTAFTVVADATNTSGDSLTLDTPLLNNDPTAIVMVTHNWSPVGAANNVYLTSPVGVWYDGTHWNIYREDVGAMPVDVAFNVLVVKTH